MIKEFFTPMEPILKSGIINHPDFIHQIKWDGIRGILYIENSKVKILTRKNIDITSKYPELQMLKKNFKGRNGILDGEIVIFDDKSKPDFQKILSRHMLKSNYKINHFMKSDPVSYIVFDILYLDNQDLRQFKYSERKTVLQKHYSNSGFTAITDDFSDGHSLFDIMKEKKMEGIVSKNRNSKYIAGKKHNQWIKTKIKREMLTVIGGLKLKNNLPVSLLLGIYDQNNLLYIGNASSGLKQNDLYLLKAYMPLLKNASSPFANHFNDSNTLWLKPALTCYISYLERNNHGHLRHPEIIGFSDKNPEEALGEEIICRQ